MKILFITASRLGDAVLSTGLVDHIISQYPGARLTIACGPLATSLFEGVPGLDRVIPLKKQSFNRHWLKLWGQVAFTRWDIVIDLRNSAVSRLILAKRRYIYTKRVDNKKHKVEQSAAVMGLSTPPVPCIWISREQQEKAEELIPEGMPVLAVGPTANWPGKTWPVERYNELVVLLTAAEGILPKARVAVFAAPGEEDGAYRVLNTVPQSRQIDVIAKTDPGTVAAALSRCSLYIGNDSGLMHCAAAAKIPTVGLFGPSYPHLYRPWGGHCIYVQTPESCDELTDFEGYDPKIQKESLMLSLDVKTVKEAIEKFFKS